MATRARTENYEARVWRRKDGTYGVYAPRWDEHGAYDPINTTRRHREDALRLKREAVAAFHAHRPQPSARESVAQFFEEWLTHKRLHLKPLVYERYEAIVRRHLLPALGHHKLAALNTGHIQAAFDTFEREKHLAASTLKFHRSILHSALTDAEEWGKLARNPCTKAVKIKRAPKITRRVLTEDEEKRMLTAIPTDRLEAFWLLLLTTAMRRGELFGLRWHDVDLARGALHIGAQIQYQGEWVFSRAPKFEEFRTITLAPACVAALKRWQAVQRADKKANLAVWWQAPDPDFADLVFTERDGRPMHVSSYKRRLASLLKRAEVERVNDIGTITAHTFRRSTATKLLRKGRSVAAVARMLGHKDGGRTLLEHYAHPDAAEVAEVCREAGDVLTGYAVQG